MATAIPKKLPIFPRLVIKKDTWHYHYYEFIREFWGLGKPPVRTSICPYVQVLFLSSLFAVIMSPLFVIGWLLLKSMRLIYKALDKLGLNGWIDALDKSPIGKWVDYNSGEGMKDSPAWATSLTSILAIIGIAVIGGLIFSICWLLYQFVVHIPMYPHWAYVAIVTAGWHLFHLYVAVGAIIWAVGQAIWWAGWGIAWFFTNAAIWLGVLKVLAWIVGIGVPSCLVGYAVMKICQTDWGKKLLDKLIFKMNGYGEAKRKAAERRAAMPVAEVDEWYHKPYRPNPIAVFFKKLGSGFVGLFKTDVKVGNVVTTVLTPLGILWHYLKGLKQGVCPLIEFFDDESLANVARISQECEGRDVLNTRDYYQLNRLREQLSEQIEPTKQSLYDSWFDEAKRAAEGYDPASVRIRIHVGKYILGHATRNMTLEAVNKDLATITDMRAAEDLLRKVAEKERELKERAEYEAADPVAKSTTVNPETEIPLSTETKPPQTEGDNPTPPIVC